MTEKYRGEDAVILRNAEGAMLRLDPARYGEGAAKEAKKAGWEEAPPKPDGFRKRPKRDPKHMAQLIKDGIVADPATGGQPHQEYGPETFVFEVPLGGFSAAGMTPGVEE